MFSLAVRPFSQGGGSSPPPSPLPSTFPTNSGWPPSPSLWSSTFHPLRLVLSSSRVSNPFSGRGGMCRQWSVRIVDRQYVSPVGAMYGHWAACWSCGRWAVWCPSGYPRYRYVRVGVRYAGATLASSGFTLWFAGLASCRPSHGHWSGCGGGGVPNSLPVHGRVGVSLSWSDYPLSR